MLPSSSSEDASDCSNVLISDLINSLAGRLINNESFEAWTNETVIHNEIYDDSVKVRVNLISHYFKCGHILSVYRLDGQRAGK